MGRASLLLFTLAAVLVLALGIGVNTSVFSLLNAMLFAPPSYAQPSEVAQVFRMGGPQSDDVKAGQIVGSAPIRATILGVGTPAAVSA